MDLLSDGLCYQRQNTCENKQLYDYIQNECVYSCQNGTIENYEQKICQNIIGCNQINEYSSQHIKDNIKSVFASSNGNIIIIYEYCQIAIANQNLQIISILKLLPKSEQKDDTVYSYNQDYAQDIIYCQSRIYIVLYDVVTEQQIKFPFSEIASQYFDFMIYVKSWQLLIFNNQGLDEIIIYSVSSKNKTIINRQAFDDRQIKFYYQISKKQKIFCLMTGKSNFPEATFFQVQNNNSSVTQLQNINLKCLTASIVNEDLNLFICDLQSWYEIHQIITNSTSVYTQLVQQINKQYDEDNCADIPCLFQEIMNYYYQESNLMISSYMLDDTFCVYQITNNYTQYTLKYTQKSLGYSNIFQSSKAGQSDILVAYRQGVYYYIPLNSNFLSSISSFSQFEGDYWPDKFIYDYKVFVPNIWRNQLNIFIFNLLDKKQVGNIISLEGYTMSMQYHFQLTNSYSKSIRRFQTFKYERNSFVGYKNRYYIANSLNQEIQFIQEQDIALPFYQHNQLQKSIIINQQVVSDNSFQRPQFVEKILNSNCLFTLIYQTQDLLQILRILDICSQQIIFKLNVPQLNLFQLQNHNKGDFAELIVEYNYIIFYHYKILYDLINKNIIESFSDQPMNYQTPDLFLFGNKIIVIEKDITRFYDLKLHIYQTLFEVVDFKYLAISIVTEQIENTQSILFVDQYLYFLFIQKPPDFLTVDYNFTMKAFSLQQMSFSGQIQYFINLHYGGVFQLPSNKLAIFQKSQNTFSIYSSDLQLISTTPLIDKAISYFYKSENMNLVLFSTKGQLVQFNLQTQISQSIQLPIIISIDLLFFGSRSALVQRERYVIHYLSMQILKVIDVYQWSIYQFFYPNNYASISINLSEKMLDENFYSSGGQKMVQSFNLEKKSYTSYPISLSYDLIFLNQNNYDIYYIDRKTSKVLKKNIFTNETQEYIINALINYIYVDPQLNAALFTTQTGQMEELTIFYLNSPQNTIKLFTYDGSILSFQVCQNLQVAIIRTISKKFFVVDLSKLKNVQGFGCKQIEKITLG
ncbi:hypothetical protein ABPG73_019308 [Tetrahymena malaccensis]